MYKNFDNWIFHFINIFDQRGAQSYDRKSTSDPESDETAVCGGELASGRKIRFLL